MNVTEYCKENKLSKRNLADKAKISSKTMTKICCGKLVTCKIAIKIEIATCGNVEAASICRDKKKLSILREFWI